MLLNKPVVLERYGRRRAAWRPPRWLVLLLLGVAAGAAGVITVQQRVLPPRLSAAESSQLSADLDTAIHDRQRLRRELDSATHRLNTALADTKTLTQELVAARARADRLREDLAATVEALPPDPRDGQVAVRAARFATQGGALTYELVLTRARAAATPLNGALAFTVEGDAARGGDATLALKALPISLTGHEVARGSVPLPSGYRARQVTVRVLTHSGGQLLGMRVLPVK